MRFITYEIYDSAVKNLIGFCYQLAVAVRKTL